MGKTLWLVKSTGRHADHPHAGGENEEKPAPVGRDYGSSPRRWGKRHQADPVRGSERIIPTQVGKTLQELHRNDGGTDHPHAGGENWTKLSGVPGSVGSSPRRWGKRTTDTTQPPSSRIIPTQVGKTSRAQCGQINTADHPHAGGENVPCGFPGGDLFGSSPRRWGKPDAIPLSAPGMRIIPTQVGKTFETLLAAVTDTDHPHAGGENPPRRHGTETGYGSSPRRWGKRYRSAERFRLARIIPTQVGKTLSGTWD